VSGVLNRLHVELAASRPKNVGVDEGVGEPLTDGLGVPAPAVTVAH